MPSQTKNDNPWTVLLNIKPEPIFEPGSYSCWNAWACQKMSRKEKEEFKDGRGGHPLKDVPDWNDVKKEVTERFQKALPHKSLPDPTQTIKFIGSEIKPTDFTGLFFPADVHFAGAQFAAVSFIGAIFNRNVEFTAATFKEACSFTDATFAAGASFGGTIFQKRANFSGCSFTGTSQEREVNFANTEFFGPAEFDEAVFSESDSTVYFNQSLFREVVSFKGAKFRRNVWFKSAQFNERSQFSEAVFAKEIAFTDAVFNAPSNFRDAKFETRFPNLEGTLLHNNTNLTTEEKFWPEVNDKQDIKSAVHASACLRHNMASQGLSEAAHFFFRKEMQHKAKLAKWWERPIYCGYSMSDYGFGVWQPAIALISLIFLGGVALKASNCMHWGTAAGLSFSNVFRFFGFQRAFFEADVFKSLEPWLKIGMGLQSVLGFLFLFFLGLGLRNRFRLK